VKLANIKLLPQPPLRLTHEILEGLSANDLRAASTNAIIAHPLGIIQGVDHLFTGKVERVDVDLRQVEAALISLLAACGVPGERSTGYTGVWTDGRKIASIGVHARDWVTWHGFALNVSTDLSYFDLIVPCGIPDVVMTSIARETSRSDLLLGEVAVEAERAFGETFGLDVRRVSVDWLASQAEAVEAKS
jgi:hypothetical protein